METKQRGRRDRRGRGAYCDHAGTIAPPCDCFAGTPLPKMRHALVPPKPKLFDATYSNVASRPRPATKSSAGWAQARSRFSTLHVGGAFWSRKERSEKSASVAPAAPSMCPVMDLVEEMRR